MSPKRGLRGDVKFLSFPDRIDKSMKAGACSNSLRSCALSRVSSLFTAIRSSCNSRKHGMMEVSAAIVSFVLGMSGSLFGRQSLQLLRTDELLITLVVVLFLYLIIEILYGEKVSRAMLLEMKRLQDGFGKPLLV